MDIILSNKFYKSDILYVFDPITQINARRTHWFLTYFLETDASLEELREAIKFDLSKVDNIKTYIFQIGIIPKGANVKYPIKYLNVAVTMDSSQHAPMKSFIKMSDTGCLKELERDMRPIKNIEEARKFCCREQYCVLSPIFYGFVNITAAHLAYLDEWPYDVNSEEKKEELVKTEKEKERTLLENFIKEIDGNIEGLNEESNNINVVEKKTVESIRKGELIDNETEKFKRNHREERLTQIEIEINALCKRRNQYEQDIEDINNEIEIESNRVK